MNRKRNSARRHNENCAASSLPQVEVLQAAIDRMHALLGTAAHNLRNPLTAVAEYSSLLEDGLKDKLPVDQSRYLSQIRSAVDVLSTMICDMLDAGSCERGALKSRRRTATVAEIIAAVRGALTRRAAVRCWRLELELPENLPSVYCDSEQVGRILTYVIAKLTSDAHATGQIRIRAFEDTEASQVVIGVSGPFTSETLESAVPRGTRSELVSPASSGRNFTPALVAELVERNLADVELAEHAGGQELLIKLPAAGLECITLSYIRKTRKSLDGPISVSLSMATAAEGTDAIGLDILDEVLDELPRGDELLLRLNAARWLLLGRQEPGESLPAIDRFRSGWERLRGEVPHLPQVTFTTKGDYQIDPCDGQEMLNDSWGAAQERDSMAHRILLVDDERDIVEALGLRLRALDFEVFTAHNGIEGLAQASEHRPDLILLDVRMPKMDGLTMLSQLRQQPEIRDIPVVMLSASHDQRQRAIELGARQFLQKPYDHSVLLLTIKASLAQPRLQGAATV